MIERLLNALPPWFGEGHSILDVLLTGSALCSQLEYDNILYAAQQTRIKTATGVFLDLAATDYFDSALPRLLNEPDFVYSARIIDNLLKEKATFAALYRTVSSVMTTTAASVAVYEYGSTVPGNILQEDGSDMLMEDGTTTVDTETVLQTIPVNAVAIGIDPAHAAARFGTALDRFEALVIVSGASISANFLQEDGTSTILLEDGSTTIDTEDTDPNTYQYLVDAISRVKPIGTTVWLYFQ